MPDNLRSYVWQMFADFNKNNYEKELFKKLDEEKVDKEIEDLIIKDLDRTFPACQLFTDKYGNGQRKLFRVLANYSKYDKEIGYIQGMGFIVALFLIYMDEESTFFMLDILMKKYKMKGIFLPGFPDLNKKFYVLLNLEKKFIPKVYEILKRDSIMPSLYASEWFICLFCKELNFNVLVRIMDTFLLEGEKVIYRFALAFLKLKEKAFINGKQGIVSTMETIKIKFDEKDKDQLYKYAFSFDIRRHHLKKFEEDFEKNKSDTKNEFISLLNI